MKKKIKIKPHKMNIELSLNKEGKVQISKTKDINYSYIEPNSHFWTSLDMLLNNLKGASQMNIEYLVKGLENTQKQGYYLEKTKPEPGPETNPLVINMKQTFDKCLELVKRKNNDYSGIKKADIDPYSNFRKCESVGISVEKGILVRMMDKISRASNLLEQEAQVKDEAIEDTLTDLINYTAILQSYIKNKNGK